MTSVNEMPVEIRQACPDDIEYLMEFTESEGWDYTHLDYKAALSVDSNFLCVAIDISGNPIGFGGLTQIAPGCMYPGAYVVKEGFRQKGIGRQIWNTLLTRANNSYISLDAVPAMTGWYAKQGFIYVPFQISYYSLNVTCDMTSKFSLSNCDVVPYTKSIFPLLMEYDGQIYPNIDRERLLCACIQNSSAFIAFLDGNLVGFGSMQEISKKIYSMRYLCADNTKIFQTLFGFMLRSLPNESFVKFSLLSDKPMPEYLKENAKILGTAQRMSTYDIKINKEKLWMHSGTKF